MFAIKISEKITHILPQNITITKFQTISYLLKQRTTRW